MKFNDKEFKILKHSLGFDFKKPIPNEFYREYFQANEGHSDYDTLLSLYEKDLMHKTNNGQGLTYWIVSDDAKELFKSIVEEEDKQLYYKILYWMNERTVFSPRLIRDRIKHPRFEIVFKKVKKDYRKFISYSKWRYSVPKNFFEAALI